MAQEYLLCCFWTPEGMLINVLTWVSWLDPKIKADNAFRKLTNYKVKAPSCITYILTVDIIKEINYPFM